VSNKVHTVGYSESEVEMDMVGLELETDTTMSG
jgi:hypothetical protein